MSKNVGFKRDSALLAPSKTPSYLLVFVNLLYSKPPVTARICAKATEIA